MHIMHDQYVLFVNHFWKRVHHYTYDKLTFLPQKTRLSFCIVVFVKLSWSTKFSVILSKDLTILQNKKG